MMPLWYYETRSSVGKVAPHVTDDFVMIPKGAGYIRELPRALDGYTLEGIAKWADEQRGSLPTSGETQEEPDLRIADTTMVPLVPVPDREPEYVGSDSRVPPHFLSFAGRKSIITQAAEHFRSAIAAYGTGEQEALAMTRIEEALFWATKGLDV